MEEIVGDIRDEYDINEEYEYIQQNENEYLMDAGMDIDDINTLMGISMSADETDTLGGYIYLKIGNFKCRANQLRHASWSYYR